MLGIRFFLSLICERHNGQLYDFKNHSVIKLFSNVCPSCMITGSIIIAQLIGHVIKLTSNVKDVVSDDDDEFSSEHV